MKMADLSIPTCSPSVSRWQPLFLTHRVTGVILFVGVGFALYALDTALASPEGLRWRSSSSPSRWGSLSCLASRRA